MDMMEIVMVLYLYKISKYILCSVFKGLENIYTFFNRQNIFMAIMLKQYWQ